MGFWEAMERGAGATVRTHGETITVAGKEVEAVVDPASLDKPRTEGGHREVVAFDFLVVPAAGDGIAEGDAVRARGMEGVVVKKAHEGSQWRVSVGPRHRLGGGSLPGL